MGSCTELGKALPRAPGLEQGPCGSSFVSLRKKLSPASTGCHLVPRSVWCRGAATLSHRSLWVGAMVAERMEGQELLCGLGRGWEWEEREGRISGGKVRHRDLPVQGP